MKFHWGHGAGILYLSFVAFMLFLVYKTTQGDFSLDTDDYYREAIEYQSKIDKQKNSAALAEKLSIELLHDQRKVRVTFPKNLSNLSGEIILFRPSDSKKDVKIPVQPDSGNVQDVSLVSVEKGLWRVKVEWKSDDMDYFDEKTLIIQ